MPLLQGDFAEVLLACATDSSIKRQRSPSRRCAAPVWWPPAGYPGTPQLGDPSAIKDQACSSDDANQLFCAGVKADANGNLQTSGGRLAAVAQGQRLR